MRHRDHGGRHRVLIDSHSDRMLGFAAFRPEAGELMGTVQVAMLAGAPYTLLRDAVFTHPTMREREFGNVVCPACPNDATRLRRNANTRQSARKD